jgi:hypothetical protein
MTMHERPPEVSGSYDRGSYDQPQAAAGETRPDAGYAPADVPTGSAEPSPRASAPSEAFGQQNEPTPPGAPAEASTAPVSAQHQSSTEDMLFAEEELADLRARWAGVQAAFVDDPKDCVQKADVLVSDLVEQLTNGFAQARSRLEEQWARGEQASTEDLRVALMHYREFFERLLAV